MSEAEKEAIERAKFLVSIPTYLEKEMCKNLLNYIEKLQKENQELKEEIKSIIEDEFSTFTSHDNNFNLGDLQLLEDTIIDKINEKVEEENEQKVEDN